MRTLVAFFASHSSDVDWPRSIAAGAARSVIAGAGGGGAGTGSTGRGAGGAAATFFLQPAIQKPRLKKTDKLGDANIVFSFRSPCECMVGIYQLLKRVHENRSGHLKLPQAFLDRSS